MHSIEHLGPKKWFGFGDGSTFFVSETVGLTWLVMIALTIFAIIVRSKLQERPGKLQSIVEWYVEFTYNTIESTMGKHNMHMAPFFSAMFLFLILGNALGLLGLRPITTDLNTTGALALFSFICIHAFSIRSKGIGGYFKHMADPMAFLLPINAIAELAVPLSLALRLFGNITGGAIIMALVMTGLSGITEAWNISIPFFELVIPIALNLFFDVFEPILQAFIFFTLSITFFGINNQLPHEGH